MLQPPGCGRVQARAPAVHSGGVLSAACRVASLASVSASSSSGSDPATMPAPACNSMWRPLISAERSATWNFPLPSGVSVPKPPLYQPWRSSPWAASQLPAVGGRKAADCRRRVHRAQQIEDRHAGRRDATDPRPQVADMAGSMHLERPRLRCADAVAGERRHDGVGDQCLLVAILCPAQVGRASASALNWRPARRTRRSGVAPRKVAWPLPQA